MSIGTSGGPRGKLFHTRPRRKIHVVSWNLITKLYLCYTSKVLSLKLHNKGLNASLENLAQNKIE